MKRNKIDAPQSALIDRTAALNSFIIANGTTLIDAAHEAGKYRLFFTTPEVILAKLANSLHRYGGPIVEPAFMKWARRFVVKEAARYRITAEILEEYENLIHKAIHESLWKSAVELSIEHQDIYWEVVWLIFQRAHSLDRSGTAKLSTRIYALVKKHIYLYHNSLNANRKSLVRRHRYELQCEQLSDEELAAMRAAEREDKPYDPGYAEIGLSVN